MSSNQNASDVIYFTRLHPIIFLGPFLGVILTIIVAFYLPELRTVAPVLSLFWLAWGIMTWVTYHFSSITIKKKQVILRTGLIVRQTVDIPFDKIETIDIRQSILGAILHYGTLIITGTGGTRHFISFVHSPLTCRRYIEQIMSDRHSGN